MYTKFHLETFLSFTVQPRGWFCSMATVGLLPINVMSQTTESLLGRAGTGTQSFQALYGHNRMVPWVQHVSLQRCKEPSQPVLGSCLCLGIFSPVLDLLCTSLFCLRVCIMTPGQPHCCICSWRGENGVLCL